MNQDETAALIISTILSYYPAVQGIYLFGSYGSEKEWRDRDVDIALLLPPEQARNEKMLLLSQCRFDLEEALSRPVDLLNARLVSTVFQKEIIGGTRMYCSDPYAADEFEMLVISHYQKLNQERQDILDAFYKTGRAYAV